MRDSTKEWLREAIDRRQVDEAESLAGSGLSLQKAHERRVAQNLEEAAPLLSQLAAVGVKISQGNVYLDLGSEEHAKALPVLFENLSRNYSEDIQNFILQHFAHKTASSYRTAFIAALKSPGRTSRNYRLNLAIAINAMSTPANESENIALALDRSLGASRLGLLSGLARSRTDAAKQALLDLRVDPDLSQEVTVILERKSRYLARNRRGRASAA